MGNLKIRREHYAHLLCALVVLNVNGCINEAVSKYKSEGLSFRRLQWDALHAAVDVKWICDELYPYLNDDHIQSALNAAFKEMRVSYA